jgi:hypothetical protein
MRQIKSFEWAELKIHLRSLRVPCNEKRRQAAEQESMA